MQILVTGGAGFIGSHLCRALLDKGEEVICLDNLFSGRKKNVYGLMARKEFEFVRHDVVEPILLEVDQIYHLACPASPVYYQHNPVKTIKVNVMGTLNMLGLAKRVGARILLASTSEVYGDPKEHPQKETYWGNVNPNGPRSCYDEGKRCAESLMMDYHRQNSVQIRIARIFNTYGPHMRTDDGRVVTNFIDQALKNEPVTIYGSGSQTRSFCYVDDMVDGLIRLMGHGGADFTGPVNLGNPMETTIEDLAELVIRLTGSSSPIRYHPLPVDDPARRCPDISLASKILGWKPSTLLEAGLKTTIDSLKSEGGKP